MRCSCLPFSASTLSNFSEGAASLKLVYFLSVHFFYTFTSVYVSVYYVMLFCMFVNCIYNWHHIFIICYFYVSQCIYSATMTFRLFPGFPGTTILYMFPVEFL